MLTRKVVLRAILCTVLGLLPLPDLETSFYDWKLRFTSSFFTKPVSDLVILEVSRDDFDLLKSQAIQNQALPSENSIWRAKYENLRAQFLWDDGAYKYLLEKLLSFQPNRILITFFFGENLVVLKDNPHLQKLVRDKRIIWSSQFDIDQKLLKPAPELTGTENYGFSNFHPDPDGIIRSAYLVYRNHISIAYRSLFDNPQVTDWRVPLGSKTSIFFNGPAGTYRSCSLRELLIDQCGDLNKKTIIVSPTSKIVAGASLYQSPLGYLSRGEILANIIDTVRYNANLVTIARPYFVPLIFFYALFLSILFSSRKFSRKMIGAVASLLLITVSSILLFAYSKLQLPLVPIYLTFISSVVLYFWVYYNLEESKRWKAEKQTQYLQEIDELKSNFMSLMSHDLKTPIAKVQALTERLKRYPELRSEQREIVESIEKSNNELSEYILSILNFQRIENQELRLHKKSHDINVLIEEVVKRLQPLAEEKSISIELDLEPMFSLEFDEQLIRQVLNNLIDNSIKYNEKGISVIIRSRDLESKIQVSIEDNGVGIEPEQLPHLFQKFSRKEKTTSERVKGTGLGLYLAKYFIELHGGEISAQSTPGEKTLFSFTIPISEEQS
ncbi:MAG: ATP-binding protein [Oligoflexia bacterium]|nr:ATP-binding protein [Oligoflexia bacterium]